MKNLPHPNKTQQIANDAIASINYYKEFAHTTWSQPQVEKELNLFYKQQEALDQPVAEHLRPDEKNILRQYYKDQIRQRLNHLSVFLQVSADTAKAIKMEVVNPEILS